MQSILLHSRLNSELRQMQSSLNDWESEVGRLKDDLSQQHVASEKSFACSVVNQLSRDTTVKQSMVLI